MSRFLEDGGIDDAVYRRPRRWTGDLGDGPCPARPAFTRESQGWLFKHGTLSHPPFQPQHLTWKLGSETQRKCTVGRPKGKASGG